VALPPISSAGRAAYTTGRPDIVDAVPTSAMRILDVGCSNGAVGAALKAAVINRTVIGIDADDSLLADARVSLDHVIKADLNHFSYRRAFASNAFDCLIFADVLEHLTDPWKHLRDAMYCLGSGGSVIVSLPNIRHLTAIGSIFLKGTFPRRDRGIFDKTHLHWFTISDGRKLVEQAGLEVADIHCSLRARDRGGGLLNKLTIRGLGPMRNFFPIREFLTYQYCIRGIKEPLRERMRQCESDYPGPRR
jgi:2-polyprenyl-3-methyl-5-hydroxy-6-metoxy-1,4-benzoquinol methylase